MLDIERKSEKAAQAYERHDFNAAMLLMNEVIEHSPESPHGVASRHLRALAYESGNTPEGMSLRGALVDFEFLAERSEIIGSVGLIGTARVLKTMDSAKNFQKIEQLCMNAWAVDHAPEAASLLGDLYAEVAGNEALARQWYWKSYRAGSVASLLSVGLSHERERHRVRAAFFAVLFALKSRVPGTMENPGQRTIS